MIESISVVGDFNNWDWQIHPMEKDEQGLWQTEVELEPGEYKYKYLVNNEIRLNDPSANLYYPDKNGEVTSVLFISSDGSRMINTQKYEIKLENYSLFSKVLDEAPKQSRRLFILPREDRAVTRLEFSIVEGIHTISVLWYEPGQKLYKAMENILWSPAVKDKNPLVYWFWLELIKGKMTQGLWTLKLFIDGAFLLEDYFEIIYLPNELSDALISKE
jgi:hypothetical protein